MFFYIIVALAANPIVEYPQEEERCFGTLEAKMVTMTCVLHKEFYFVRSLIMLVLLVGTSVYIDR